MRKLSLVCCVLLSCGALAACGDDEEIATTSTPAAESAGGTTTESESAGTTTESSGGGAAAADPQVQQAIESCKQSIDAQPALSEDAKSDLRDLCDKAASGDAQAVQDATKEVCRKIVEETVPAGSARDQAAAACDSATANP